MQLQGLLINHDMQLNPVCAIALASLLSIAAPLELSRAAQPVEGEEVDCGQTSTTVAYLLSSYTTPGEYDTGPLAEAAAAAHLSSVSLVSLGANGIYCEFETCVDDQGPFTCQSVPIVNGTAPTANVQSRQLPNGKFKGTYSFNPNTATLTLECLSCGDGRGGDAGEE